jgi:two-component system, chemotaxis family, CheB/CheR fusion protein
MNAAQGVCCGMWSRAKESFSLPAEWYRWMVQSIEGYAVFSTDRDNRILTWDQGAERLFGYGRNDVLGERAHFIFTPEDIRDHVVEKELREAATNRQAADERWHVKKDGSLFWASGLMMKLFDDEGRHVGFLKVVQEREPPDRRRREL